MKTTSLEISKQLKECGFPQETEFYWRVPDDEEKSTVESREKMKKFYYIFPTYASPTADEILDALGDKFGVLERFKDGSFGAYYPNDIGVSVVGDSPVEVLAELWLKTQYIDSPEMNHE